MPGRPSKTGSAGKSRWDFFHTGTNNLPSRKGSKYIAEIIINLAMSLKTQSCGVSFSGITVRKDKYQNKVQEINDQLIDLYQV